MFSVLCSLNLYPGPNTQLAIFFPSDNSSLGFCHSILFWFSSCRALCLSLSLNHVCSFICLEPPALLVLYCLLDHLIFSFGFSYMFYENCPSLPWGWISSTWTCFLSFSHWVESIHQQVRIVPPLKHLKSIPFPPLLLPPSSPKLVTSLTWTPAVTS